MLNQFGEIMPEVTAAGADITEAAIKCSAGIPKEMYAAITPPAIVANPPVITAWSSERVKDDT